MWVFHLSQKMLYHPGFSRMDLKANIACNKVISFCEIAG